MEAGFRLHRSRNIFSFCNASPAQLFGRLRVPGACLLLFGGMLPAASLAQDFRRDLLDLSLEELGQIVTSVSRRPEQREAAAASVYVITRDQIRRSGVTSIPEALRLAPGVEVARNNSSSYTISIRGFSSDLSNKLLVLIDGRSVYSPLYAGVFWDAQDVVLEDIDRIEVISGPGGTAWGANAVNGVINIITRSAWDTQGGLLTAHGGTSEYGAGFRYGGRLNDEIAARAYVKGFERDGTRAVAGGLDDDWRRKQAGFKLDWRTRGGDGATLQGDIYDGDISSNVRTDFTPGTLPELVPGTVRIDGHNVIARWQRAYEKDGDLSVQLFYDRTRRDIPGNFNERRRTLDFELIHDLPTRSRHDVIWGWGYRLTSDEIDNSQFSTFDPPSRTDHTVSAFIQDRIELSRDRLFLTLGTKLERNDYSGTEHQPNVRLAWLPDEHQAVWAAASRAVRVPARLNHDLTLFAPIGLVGDGLPAFAEVRTSESFRSEELLAYEAGYRISMRANLALDLALFHHRYDYLQTNEAGGAPFVAPGPPAYLVIPVVQGNGIRGDTYGGTVSVKWHPLPYWRLDFQLSHLKFDLELRPGSGDVNGLNVAGNSPEYQAAVYSYLDLAHNLSIYTGLRYVDELPNRNVPSYVAADLHLVWQATRQLRAGLTVHNLNDKTHQQFGGSQLIERSALLSLAWTF